MDEFLKMPLEAAKADGAVVSIHKVEGKGSDSEHTEHNEPEHCKCSGHCPDSDMVQDAEEIAKLNKVLFDAHIRAGFTEEQAIMIVAASNN